MLKSLLSREAATALHVPGADRAAVLAVGATRVHPLLVRAAQVIGATTLVVGTALAILQWFGGDLLSPRQALAAERMRVDTLALQVRSNSVTLRDQAEMIRFGIDVSCANAVTSSARSLCAHPPYLGATP